MAEISIEKQRSGTTWPWAALAIIATAALMIWLFSTRPEDTGSSAAVEEESVPEAPAAETVELSAIGGDPASYMGRRVRINNLPVTAPIGSRVFLADNPAGSPILVVVDPSVADVSWVTEGTTLTAAEGTVEQVTEAKLDELVASGALLAEGRPMAVFSTHYFNVTGVER